MSISRLQRRNLQLYLRFRGQRMTLGGLVWANRRIYALLTAVFILVGWAARNGFGAPGMWCTVIGFIAMMARDLGFYRRSVALWPLLDQVLDWDKVEELISTSIPPAPERKER